MFDRLFTRVSTVAHHSTAPYAEERARYLRYCERRGDSRSTILCKAHDLLWISRKLSERDLPTTIEQVREVVIGEDPQRTNGPDLDLFPTQRRLTRHACAWFRYLGYLREPDEQTPFGSRLDEYCEWARQQRGLTADSVRQFRGTIDGSFYGLASWVDHSPAFMFGTSTLTLLLGVLKDGLGSPFATQ
jgi:integrase/recombinase XerD